MGFSLNRRSVALTFLMFALVFWGLWLSGGRISLFQTSNAAPKIYETNTLWLTEEGQVKQDFVARYPGLSQVDVVITHRAMADHAEPPLIFYLRENCEASQDLRSLIVRESVRDEDGRSLYTFSFRPVDQSAGQKYCFILKANLPEATESQIGIIASSADIYPEGQAFYQAPPAPKAGQQESQALSAKPSDLTLKHRLFLPLVQRSKLSENIDVIFQLHYAGRTLETMDVFSARLVEHKPYWWGHFTFYIVLLIIYISSLFLLIQIALSNRI